MLNKKIAFLTEMGFVGTIPSEHPNMRTEFAWMHALDAVHHPIGNFQTVRGYDEVFIIFPKGKLFVSAEGIRISDKENPVSQLLRAPIVEVLKQNNDRVHYIQEGPVWWFNDYDVEDQLYFYNLLFQCDTIFSHNEVDTKFYKGLFPGKPVHVIQTLMFDHNIADISSVKDNKCIIGGNFARWYGGFQSYLVAQEFGVPIWAQESHAKRANEENIDGLNHLPRLMWNDWMKELSTFKYAVHLMPTVAAGTFSLNCSYLGIPCIGNEKVDTQRILHPELSVDVDDVESARRLAILLHNDVEFYTECSKKTKELYDVNYHHSLWLDKFLASI